MDIKKSSAPAHPTTDETIEAHYSGLERLGEAPHGCYEGLVFIGHLEITDEGEEVEVITAVPCRRCDAL